MATKLWVYLGRRDKTGLRLLVVFNGRPQRPVRLTDPSVLLLPPALETEITELTFDNRMNWELWAESADTYDDLRDAVKDRGYTGVPAIQRTELTGSGQTVNVNRLPQNGTMIRKAF